MAHDEVHAARIRTALATLPAVSEKKMFGGLCFLLEGHMLGGLTGKGDFVFRFDPSEHEAVLAEPHVREMDFTGRPMRGFVFVAAEGVASDEALGRWLARALIWVSQLAPAETRRDTETAPSLAEGAGLRGSAANPTYVFDPSSRSG